MDRITVAVLSLKVTTLGTTLSDRTITENFWLPTYGGGTISVYNAHGPYGQ